MEPTEVVKKAETPINGYLATFKFYDSKKRRLSIFGREDPISGKLAITVLTLSETPEVVEKTMLQKNAKGKPKKAVQEVTFKYDVFSRKDGRKTYEEKCIGANCENCPGQTVLVDIIDERPRYTFLHWCNNRFYRPQKETITLEKIKYVRGNKYVFPEKKKKVQETTGE